MITLLPKKRAAYEAQLIELSVHVRVFFQFPLRDSFTRAENSAQWRVALQAILSGEIQDPRTGRTIIRVDALELVRDEDETTFEVRGDGNLYKSDVQ